MHPLIFDPIYKPKMWGGDRIFKHFDRPTIGNEPIGESWELADLEEDASRVVSGPAAGKTLTELVADWEKFIRAVKIHGEGHRDLAGDAVREVVARLSRLETPDCAFMEREARDLVDGILEDFREKDREYDRTTQTGRTQGAVWPPRRGG